MEALAIKALVDNLDLLSLYIAAKLSVWWF